MLSEIVLGAEIFALRSMERAKMKWVTGNSGSLSVKTENISVAEIGGIQRFMQFREAETKKTNTGNM